jgi:ABC-type transporter Mla subunit MlaD
MEAPRLKRGLFGYTGRSVRLVLADRDGQFLRAIERGRETQAYAGELAAEVRAVLDDLEKQTARLREAEDAIERREDLHDLLRAELAAARRDFVRAHERAVSAEAALAEVLSERPSGLIVLPEAAGNGSQVVLEPEGVLGSS